MSIVCHYFKSTLQSYKIVVNNEPKARNNLFTRDKKTLKRTSPTSAVKLSNFSAEVWQLLMSNLRSRRVVDFCHCSPLGETDAWG